MYRHAMAEKQWDGEGVSFTPLLHTNARTTTTHILQRVR